MKTNLILILIMTSFLCGCDILLQGVAKYSHIISPVMQTATEVNKGVNVIKDVTSPGGGTDTVQQLLPQSQLGNIANPISNLGNTINTIKEVTNTATQIQEVTNSMDNLITEETQTESQD